MQLNHITRIFVQDDCLPIFASAFDAAEEFFEYPWANVAHAADYHLVTAATYLPNPSREHSAVTWFINQTRHVSRTIPDERHHVARERCVNDFAVTVLVHVGKLKKEIEIVAVIAVLHLALRAQRAKRFGLSVVQIKWRAPHALDHRARCFGNVFAAREQELQWPDTATPGNFRQAHDPRRLAENHGGLIDLGALVELARIYLAGFDVKALEVFKP